MLDDKERRRKGILLGARLSSAMKDEKVSDVRIAAACGVSAQAVGQWRANGKVDKFYLPILARELNRDISWFFVDAKDPYAPREVGEEKSRYTVLGRALEDLRTMIDTGDLTERDVAALVNFASNFKAKK